MADATPEREPTGLEIAVVGMAGRFPGAPDLDAFWRNVRDGKVTIRRFAIDELAAMGASPARIAAPGFVPAHGALDGFDRFDAEFFGFTPREAALMDPQQRLFLETAWQALENAGFDPLRSDRTVGVFAGASANQYLHLNLEPRFGGRGSASDFQLRYLNLSDFLATRVSYKLNLRGPSATLLTGCSTSLVAVHEACLHLIGGGCDTALAGGVSLAVPQEWGYQHQEGLIFSPDGACRPFDAAGRGTLKGDGVGAVVLRRLADALRDGDPIRAVILGSAVNNDGSAKVGFAAPSLDGQVAAIGAALDIAGIDPATIGYLEAHGTGTPLGDPIEIAALATAFAQRTERRQFCALGSVKANIGHLDAAAGIAGFIKTVLAVEAGVVPPLVNFATPNPEIDFAASPVAPSARDGRWADVAARRRAAVSSFGIGGTNAHVVIEQAPPRAVATTEATARLLVLSAGCEEALDSLTESLARTLAAPDAPELAGVEAALAARHRREHCRAIVCTDAADAVARLSKDAARAAVAGTRLQGERTVAFLFPGQGAQYVGMGAGLYRAEPVFRESIDRCAEILRPVLGRDLRTLIFADAAGDASAATAELTRTCFAQPALFAIEYALARLWMSTGIVPAAMIGHSVGEWVAACLADVVTLEDALALVALRGALMEARPRGVMLAVPLGPEAIGPHLGADVSLAAVNAPARCVISGPEADVARAAARIAEAHGVQCTRLQTSHAFHSRMMEAAVPPFVEALRARRFQAPRIPFVSTVTGTWITDAEARDPAHWARNIHDTVRFAPAIGEILARPNPVLVECGPGNVLGTLARQHGPRGAAAVVCQSLRHPQKDEDDRVTFLAAAGRLWCAGVDLDWIRATPAQMPARAALPPAPFHGPRHWIDPAPAAAGEAPSRHAAPGAPLPPAQRYLAPTWTRLPPPAREESQACVVVAGSDPLGARIAARLEERGRSVALVRLDDAIDGGRATSAGWDRRRFAEILRPLLDEAGAQGAHVIWAAPTGASLDGGEGLPAGFDRLADALAAIGEINPSAVRLSVIASGLHDVTGDEELAPWNALAAGIAVVAAQEIAGLRTRIIDVAGPSSDGQLDLLLRELDAGDGEALVALRGPHRWARRFAPAPAMEPAASAPMTWLVTGGLGRIGSAIAEHLATTGGRVVVLGRSAPSKERRDAWSARGLAIDAETADVADADALRAAIARVRVRFGRIDGVVHCAGVAGLAAYRRIAQLDPAASATLLRAKCLGALAIARTLADDPPRIMVLASSLASILGGPGAAAYAAANAMLDTLAQKISRGGRTHCVAVNWDAWAEDGTPGAAAPDHGMTAAEGLASFDIARALEGVPQLLVSVTALEPRIERWIGRRGRDAGAPAIAATAGIGSPAAATATDGDDGDEGDGTLATLAGIWRGVLGVPEIAPQANFFELGGDSVMGLQIAARANECGLRMAAKDLFEHQTLAALAAALDARRDDGGAGASKPEPQVPAEPVFDLADLGGDEMAALRQALADAQEQAP